jgi:multidrug transporter EmrE-like cation transporter
MKLIYGILIIIGAQVISFIQLQGQGKWPWMKDHPYIMAITGIPIGFMFINSTRLINEYTQATWPGRLIGQGIGIVMFAIMSWILFEEPLTMKTGVCITLAICVILIQIFWK